MLLALILSLVLNLGLVILTLFHTRFHRELVHNLRRDRLNSFQRETELMDRLMHMSGSTWTPPPREKLAEDETLIDDETKAELEGWIQV